jgi:OmpA-OmpF porin, OOP family
VTGSTAGRGARLAAFAAVVLPCAALPGAAAALPGPGEDVVTRQAIIRSLAAPRDDGRGLVKVEDAAPGENTGTPQEMPAPAAITFRNIEFALGSSELSPRARQQLDELAAALAADELAGFAFEIAGYTDAHGSRAHNQALSERRAAVVKEFLVRRGGIESNRLVAAGFGQDRPSRPEDPYAAENRRVEVRNLGERR